MPAINTTNLSREELLEMLEQLQGDLKKERAEKEKARAEKEKAQEDYRQLMQALLLMRDLLAQEVARAPAIAAIVKELLCGDETLDQELLKMAQAIVQANIKQITTIEKYRQHFETTGSEKLPDDLPSPEELQKEVTSTTKQAMEPINQLIQDAVLREADDRRSQRRLAKALEEWKKNDGCKEDPAWAAALEAIGNNPPSPSKEKPRKGGTGRKPRARPKAAANPVLPMTKCPHCGTETVDVAAMEKQVLDAQIRSNKGFEQILQQIRLSHCPNHKCRAWVMSASEGFKTPVDPKSGMPVEAVLYAAFGLAMGTPLDRTMKHHFGHARLNHNALTEDCHHVLRNYFRPLMEAIDAVIANAPALVMDETKFPDLESQALGAAVRKERNAAEKENRKVNLSEPTSAQYLAAMTTMPRAEKQVVRFKPMAGRSSTCLIRALDHDGHLGYLVADGYAGYRSDEFRKQYPTLVLQQDLVHVRRKIYKALGMKTWNEVVKKFEAANPKKDFYLEYVAKGESVMRLYGALELFKLIFEHEQSISKPVEGESREAHLARILEVRTKYVAPLLDAADKLVAKVAESECVFQKGKWQGRRGSVYGEATAYYMNNVELMKPFLKEPSISCHSNMVEEKIRAAVVVRKGSLHMQTKQGVEDLCEWLSIFGTLRMNGIEDREGWLMELADCMYAYCTTKRWGMECLHPHTKKNRSTDFRTRWDMTELAQGFFIEPWIRNLFGGAAPTEEEKARARSWRPAPQQAEASTQA